MQPVISTKHTFRFDKETGIHLLMGIFFALFCSYINLSIVFPALILALFAFSILFIDNKIAVVMSGLLPLMATTGFYSLESKTFLSLANLYILFIIIVSLVFLFMQDTRIHFDFSPLLFFIPFYAVIIISLFFSTSPLRSFSTLIKNYIPLILYSAAWYSVIIKSENRRIAEIAFAVTITILFIVSFYQFSFNTLWFTEKYRISEDLGELKNLGEDKLRIPSLFRHSYALIEFNSFAFPFIIAKYIDTKSYKHKVITAVVGTMVLLSTIWSLQRTGLVVIVIQSVLFFLLLNKLDNVKNTIKNFLKLAIVAAAILTVALNTEHGYALLERIFISIVNPTETTHDASSTVTRLIRIKIAWNIFSAYPVWGGGLGTSADLYEKFGWYILDAAGGPHNLYLYLLSETGILSFLAFIYSYFRYIRHYWKKRWDSHNNNKANIYAIAGIIFFISVLLDGIFAGLLSGSSLVFFYIFMVYSYACFTDSTNTLGNGEK